MLPTDYASAIAIPRATGDTWRAIPARCAETLAILGAITAILVPLLLLELGARGPGPYAIVVNPFGAEAAASLVARSDGQIVRAASWSWIVIATADDDGFRARLRRAGALLVLSPLSSFACATPSKS
ncbi:hypothetical protein GCM10007036_09020 [Alsobacter metallidurans]|uniref:Uncharacterized protein n=1 Tax=Alsobacter metallidurans TaxID=340221 RepID=A0A917I514_9HYPH|nr:hypothetical protein [Alsobacter metallidurans]GGH11737.1 hypothetical protein GCM10007036_09020 [Alsobacter metallidurans]